MNNRTPSPETGTGDLVALHALGWLVAANAAGCWLAALLLWPALNDLTAPLTYGRWANVHLNLQLYGWCSIPLVGLLFTLYLPHKRDGRATVALQVWSASLAFSAAAWLSGRVSGKPFMEWTGLARWVFPAAMAVLAVALARGYVLRLRTEPEAPGVRAVKSILLVALSALPFVMAWAASPELYPPINPDSGGATGGSLLGSTLGVVAILLAFPYAAGLAGRKTRAIPVAWILLAAHVAWFELLDHGNRSHHEPAQIAAIASLIAWVPVLTVYFRCFTWPAIARPWLAALFAWGLTLVLSAFVMFLPGPLDAWKFTNVLVAHTHLAMAGMLSCLLILILVAITEGRAWNAALGARRWFWSWHGGTALMVVALTWIGMIEAKDPAVVYHAASAARAADLLRLIAGLFMTASSISWLAAVVPAFLKEHA